MYVIGLAWRTLHAGRLSRRLISFLLEQLVADGLAGAVHVALGQKADDGVQTAVVRCHLRLGRVHSLVDGLCDSYLVYLCVVAESLLDILHVGSATGEDYSSQKLVDIFGRHLEPHVGDDLLQTVLHYLDELAALHAPVLVDGVGQGVVDVVVVGVGAAVLELHVLRLTLLHLQCRDVTCDVRAAKGQHGQMAEHVLIVYRDGGRVGSEVHEQASGPALGLRKHAVCQRQRCQVHLGYLDSCLIEASVEVLVERLPPEYVEEVALQLRALYADGIDLQLRVDLVLECDGVEYFLVGIVHVAVGVHQLVHHLLCDYGLRRQLPDDHILDANDALAAYAHIHLLYLCMQLCLQALLYVYEREHCLVNIVYYASAYIRRGILLHYRKNGDAPIQILLSCYAGDL